MAYTPTNSMLPKINTLINCINLIYFSKTNNMVIEKDLVKKVLKTVVINNKLKTVSSILLESLKKIVAEMDVEDNIDKNSLSDSIDLYIEDEKYNVSLKKSIFKVMERKELISYIQKLSEKIKAYLNNTGFKSFLNNITYEVNNTGDLTVSAKEDINEKRSANI